tara:strand:- start:324 stop:530 length:207 start_codon:yes stop_codon:yes gene_type:complete
VDQVVELKPLLLVQLVIHLLQTHLKEIQEDNFLVMVDQVVVEQLQLEEQVRQIMVEVLLVEQEHQIIF